MHISQTSKDFSAKKVEKKLFYFYCSSNSITKMEGELYCYVARSWRHDIQYNGIQRNGALFGSILHNGARDNKCQCYRTQHNGTSHYDIQNNNIQHNDTQ
jgi:hypothetical protein